MCLCVHGSSAAGAAGSGGQLYVGAENPRLGSLGEQQGPFAAVSSPEKAMAGRPLSSVRPVSFFFLSPVSVAFGPLHLRLLF